MDLQPLCGSSFGALMYVAYYTSKSDKMGGINDVRKKLKVMDVQSNTQQMLRKVLLSFETYRPVGAPEAASNLLLYPHHQQSWQVLRININPYMEHLKSRTPPDMRLNSILKDATQNNERFKLFVPFGHDKGSTIGQKKTQIDKNLHLYFQRPHELESLSITQYLEAYETTRRKTARASSNFINKEGYIVENAIRMHFF